MDKKTFYVSVISGDILADKTDYPYEFEIEANEEEIQRLESLFEGKNQADWGSFIRAHIPIMPYHLDKENDYYDANLYEIYQMIYELGNEQTRRDMENLGYLH